MPNGNSEQDTGIGRAFCYDSPTMTDSGLYREILLTYKGPDGTAPPLRGRLVRVSAWSYLIRDASGRHWLISKDRWLISSTEIEGVRP